MQARANTGDCGHYPDGLRCESLPPYPSVVVELEPHIVALCVVGVVMEFSHPVPPLARGAYTYGEREPPLCASWPRREYDPTDEDGWNMPNSGMQHGRVGAQQHHSHHQTLSDGPAQKVGSVPEPSIRKLAARGFGLLRVHMQQRGSIPWDTRLAGCTCPCCRWYTGTARSKLVQTNPQSPPK